MWVGLIFDTSQILARIQTYIYVLDSILRPRILGRRTFLHLVDQNNSKGVKVSDTVNIYKEVMLKL